MIITIKKEASKTDKEKFLNYLKERNLETTNISIKDVEVYGILGDTNEVDIDVIKSFKAVSAAQRIMSPYKKTSRIFHPLDSIIEVGNIKIGGNNPLVMIGGPCSVEGEEQIISVANKVKENNGDILRGGAYKPRTSPYTFQGLEEEGIKYLKEARRISELPIISEITSISKIDEFIENVDIIQVGARNMQNYELLKALGKVDKPILLKRGLASTVEEWLMSAEYIMANGNDKVILCERGIRTFDKNTRNTLDLSVIPLIKKISHLPILVDPSHSTGRSDLVEAMCLAATAAGADGLIIEVHENPECAWSDGAQCITPSEFGSIVDKCHQIAKVIGRSVK